MCVECSNFFWYILCLLIQGASAELSLVAGDKIKLTTDNKYQEKCNKDILWLDYKNITKVMEVGGRIYIDDGLISVIVKEKGIRPFLARLYFSAEELLLYPQRPRPRPHAKC